MVQCLAHGALSVNFVILMNEETLDHLEFTTPVAQLSFSVLRAPDDSLLIASVARWAYIFQCAV